VRLSKSSFALTAIAVRTRTSKRLTVTKWSVKEVKRTDLALK